MPLFGFQQMIIMGTLKEAPRAHPTTNGTPFCEFRMAVNEHVSRGGKWVDHAEWFRCVCYGVNAELAVEHLRQGSRVQVLGKIRQQSYIDKESGVKKYSTKVQVEQLLFIGRSGIDPQWSQYSGPVGRDRAGMTNSGDAEADDNDPGGADIDALPS